MDLLEIVADYARHADNVKHTHTTDKSDTMKLTLNSSSCSPHPESLYYTKQAAELFWQYTSPFHMEISCKQHYRASP